jgi:ClpP class serine protease
MAKAFDIFRTKTEKELHYINEFANEIFHRFKDHVEANRKDKLSKNEVDMDKLFNANVYLSQEAKNVGLIDSIGDYKDIIKEKYPKVPIYDYTTKDISFHMRAGNVATYFMYYMTKMLNNK